MTTTYNTIIRNKIINKITYKITNYTQLRRIQLLIQDWDPNDPHFHIQLSATNIT